MYLPQITCFFSVSGRIHSRRVSAQVSFLDVIEGHKKLQVAIMESRHSPQEYTLFHEGLRRGDIIHVAGYPFVTKLGELSLASVKIKLLAPCTANLPLSGTLKDIELRHRNKVQDLIVNPSIVPFNLLLRASVMKSIRSFMEARNFLEVETPTLCNLAGGASARPFKTFANSMDTNLHLRIAPELYLKQLVTGGLERVYEIGKQFRNEGVDNDHHPEFTTMEVYQAYAGFEDLFAFTEDFLVNIVKHAKAKKLDLEKNYYFSDNPHRQRQERKLHQQTSNANNDNNDNKDNSNNSNNSSNSNSSKAQPDSEELVIEYLGNKVDFSTPFKRISIPSALEAALGEKLPDLSSPTAVIDMVQLFNRHRLELPVVVSLPQLIDQLVSTLIEPTCLNPTFLCDHPIAMSPLAKEYPNRPGITQRFELFVQGFEICNAYTELNDPTEQRNRFIEQAKARDHGDEEAQPMDEAYCSSLEYGLPPTVGWGLGVDRVIMLLTNSSSIRDVLPFPLLRPLHKKDEDVINEQK